jgi:hypothetical protein
VTPIPERATIVDMIVTATNEQNNKELAERRFRQNPNLLDPNRLVGTGVNGIPFATWGYPTNGSRISTVVHQL